jgi:hypothetical protein
MGSAVDRSRSRGGGNSSR